MEDVSFNDVLRYIQRRFNLTQEANNSLAIQADNMEMQVRLVDVRNHQPLSINFISGLMAHNVPFVVCSLGQEVPPFLLHVVSALSEETRRQTAINTKNALQQAKRNGVKKMTFDCIEELEKIARCYPEAECILRIATD